jgi:hypothetical protein
VKFSVITINPISTSTFVAESRSNWESASVVVEYLFMGTMGNILLKQQQITDSSKHSFGLFRLRLPIFLSYAQCGLVLSGAGTKCTGGKVAEVRSITIAQVSQVGLGDDRINNQNHGYGRTSWVNPASKHSHRSGKYREQDAVPTSG